MRRTEKGRLSIMHNNSDTSLQHYKEQYESVSMSKEAVERMKQRMNQGREDKRKMKNKKRYLKIAVAAASAAAFALVVLPNTSGRIAYAMGNIPVIGEVIQMVTFREYHYEDDKQSANVAIPEIVVDAEDKSDLSDSELQKSKDKINNEIQRISDQWVKEFMTNKKKEGFQDLSIRYEVVNTTDDYFTLKLICSQVTGSSYEENHYYTICLSTGKQMKLVDLFVKGSDYVTPICKSVKMQMTDQMKADDNVKYWLGDEDIPDWDLEKITKNAAFYVNKNGEIVICYNEGDVAPMYMGGVEFVIPNKELSGIRLSK